MEGVTGRHRDPGGPGGVSPGVLPGVPLRKLVVGVLAGVTGWLAVFLLSAIWLDSFVEFRPGSSFALDRALLVLAVVPVSFRTGSFSGT